MTLLLSLRIPSASWLHFLPVEDCDHRLKLKWLGKDEHSFKKSIQKPLYCRYFHCPHNYFDHVTEKETSKASEFARW